MLIGIGIGTYVTAGFAIVPFLVAPQDINNAIGFMAIGKRFLELKDQLNIQSWKAAANRTLQLRL